MMNLFKPGSFALCKQFKSVTKLSQNTKLRNIRNVCRQMSSSSTSGGSTYHTATKPDPVLSSQETFSETDESLPSITQIPLSKTVAWLPQPVYSTESEGSQVTNITKLDNGITVASEPKFGNFCTVGVVFDSGSRYEVAHPSGISHFLEKLAFGDTLNLKRSQIMETFEKYGGICDCQTLRDAVVYAASVETSGLEKVIEVLSEVCWRPVITPDEFALAQMAVSYDLENLTLKPEKDMILMEMIHKAAFRDNTVGLPKICPPSNVSAMAPNHIMSYLAHHHGPERMVVAGVGVDHEVLVRHVEKFFTVGSSTWDQRPDLLHPNTSQSGVDSSIAQYTGGVVTEEIDLSKVSIGPDPLPELVHLVMGLESVGHQHPDFVASCVLNVLMGGGGSFSAGGPGKGMYTRLYTHVLNRQHWMHNAVAFNHSYLDSGLFCILASSHPSHLHNLTQVLTEEMVNMSCAVTQDEVDRAKTQLLSMLMMNLESRPVIFEDLARQVLSTGKRIQPTRFAKLIRNITLDDIHKVADSMLKSKLSLAAYGSLSHLPKIDDIQSALHNRTGKLKSKSGMSFFR